MQLLQRVFFSMRNNVLTNSVLGKSNHSSSSSGSVCSNNNNNEDCIKIPKKSNRGHNRKRSQSSGSGSSLLDDKTLALAQVSFDLDDPAVDQELMEIEAEIELHIKLLKEQQAKESFLGMRIFKYRRALDDQAYLLREEERKLEEHLFLIQQQQHLIDDPSSEPCQYDEDDVEEVTTTTTTMTAEEWQIAHNLLERRVLNWERDEDALQSIVATHRQILIACEEIRRALRSLQTKRDEYAAARGVYEALIVDCAAAATAAANNNNNTIVGEETTTTTATTITTGDGEEDERLRGTILLRKSSAYQDEDDDRNTYDIELCGSAVLS